MSESGEIVKYGPELTEFRFRKKKPTYRYTVRFSKDMSTEIDKICAKYNVSPSDLIRTAVFEFVEKFKADVSADVVANLVDRSAPAAPNPTLAPRWRGNGRSDLATAKRVNQANQDRKADGRAGERLVDRNPVR